MGDTRSDALVFFGATGDLAYKKTRPFSLRHGGLGVWEVSGRYSYVDLTDGAIDGGRMSRLTGAISWYPNQLWRIEFNYGYGVLNRDGTEGRFNAFQGRAQLGF